MGSVVAKILTKIGLSLLTEKVFKELIVLALKEMAKKTDNKIDDKIAKTVEDALK